MVTFHTILDMCLQETFLTKRGSVVGAVSSNFGQKVVRNGQNKNGRSENFFPLWGKFYKGFCVLSPFLNEVCEYIRSHNLCHITGINAI